jgi:hypothetical protein
MFSILNRSFKLPQCGHRGSSASGAEETVALAADGSILPLSRIETPPQEKAAGKS